MPGGLLPFQGAGLCERRPIASVDISVSVLGVSSDQPLKQNKPTSRQYRISSPSKPLDQTGCVHFHNDGHACCETPGVSSPPLSAFIRYRYSRRPTGAFSSTLRPCNLWSRCARRLGIRLLSAPVGVPFPSVFSKAYQTLYSARPAIVVSLRRAAVFLSLACQ